MNHILWFDDDDKKMEYKYFHDHYKINGSAEITHPHILNSENKLHHRRTLDRIYLTSIPYVHSSWSTLYDDDDEMALRANKPIRHQGFNVSYHLHIS